MEKKRSLNFSKLETSLLIQLVEQKKDILECSKLDPISIEKRNSAWREITSNFNQHKHARTYRDERMLKKKYSNIKCHSKNWTFPNNEVITNTIPVQIFEDDKIDVPKVEVIREDEDIVEKDIEMKKTEPDNDFNINEEFLNLENSHKATILDEYSTSDASTTKKDSLKQEIQMDKVHQNIEYVWDIPEDYKARYSQEETKLEIEILEIEHKERMKFLKMKHSMEMEKLELKKEKHRIEIELLDKEIEFKRKKFHNSIKA